MIPATERMNQQKGVQTAAEIAARGLIGKKKRPAPNRRQANAQCGARRCLLPRAVGRGETPNTASLAAGKTLPH